MEAYQLQSPSRRADFQILPEIEMACKVKYERERMFGGAIDSYERYDVPMREATANQRFLRKPLWMAIQ
jgi:hypothetical protein